MPSLKLICINEQSPWFPFLWCVLGGNLFLPCSQRDGWLMNHLLRGACLRAVTLQMGANPKIFYCFIKLMTQAPSFQNYLLSSHDQTEVSVLSCGWVLKEPLPVLYVRSISYLGQLWHILILLVKQERRLSETIESGMRVNWKEAFGIRTGSRKAGNSAAGEWGEIEAEQNKARCLWITLGF